MKYKILFAILLLSLVLCLVDAQSIWGMHKSNWEGYGWSPDALDASHLTLVASRSLGGQIFSKPILLPNNDLVIVPTREGTVGSGVGKLHFLKYTDNSYIGYVQLAEEIQDSVPMQYGSDLFVGTCNYFGDYKGKMYRVDTVTRTVTGSHAPTSASCIRSSPISCGNKIIFSYEDHNVYPTHSYVRAINAGTMAVAWTIADKSDLNTLFAIQGTNVVWASGGNIYGANCDTGVINKQAVVSTGTASGPIIWHSPSDPVNWRVIVGGNGKVTGLDYNTWAPIWQTNMPTNGQWDDVAIDASHSVVMYVGDHELYGISATTGDILWSDTYGGDWNVGGPSAAPGYLIMQFRNDPVFRIRIYTYDGTLVKELSQTDIAVWQSGVSLSGGKLYYGGGYGTEYVYSAGSTTTTTTSTTTTTLPSNIFKRIVVRDSVSGSPISGASGIWDDNIGSFDASCTSNSAGNCDSGFSLMDDRRYILYVTKAGYYDFMLPATSGLLDIDDLGARTDDYVVKLTPMTTDIKCSVDTPGYRMYCNWKDYSGVTSSVVVKNTGGATVYSSTYTAGSSQRIYTFNTPNCEGYLSVNPWQYYKANTAYGPCIRSTCDDPDKILCGVNSDCTLGQQCTSTQAGGGGEVCAWTVYSTPACNLLYTFNKKWTFTVQVSSPGYPSRSATVQLLECYRDTDCPVSYSCETDCPVSYSCDTVSHRCVDGFSGPTLKSVFWGDRPRINVQITTPMLCKYYTAAGCVRYTDSEYRYRVYRYTSGVNDPVEIPITAKTDDGAVGNALWDDFTDLCPYNQATTDACLRDLIGKSYQYKAEAYINQETGWEMVIESGKPSVTVLGCDNAVSDRKCEVLNCDNGPGGWQICRLTSCSNKPCTTNTDCANCKIYTGGAIWSDSFCYDSGTSKTCKPYWVYCDEDSDCTSDKVFYRKDKPQVCQKQRNTWAALACWETSKDAIHISSDVFDKTNCVPKGSEGDDCARNEDCVSNKCACAKKLATPSSCNFKDLKADHPTDWCFSGTKVVGYCYNPTVETSGFCYDMGSCAAASAYLCDGGVGGDSSCKTQMSNTNAYCDDDACTCSTDKGDDGSYCKRDSYCAAGCTCQLSAGQDSGECRCGWMPTTTTTLGPGPTIPTTTTIPKPPCNYDSHCIFTQTKNGKNYEVSYQSDVPCITGRGCPIKDPLGEYVYPYAYDGCGCGEGYMCLQDPAKANGVGKCYPLRVEGYKCDKANAVNGKFGDVLCDSFNCMGDAWDVDGATCKKDSVKCTANAIGTTADTALFDLENYCHCEIVDSSGNTIGGPDGDSTPCADVYGNELNGRSNVKNNAKFCFSDDLTYGAPSTHKDYGCYRTYIVGAVCQYDYQCESQNCKDNVCSESDNDKDKKYGEECTIYNSYGTTSPYPVWNTRNNGETTSNVWTDNCNDFTSVGQLYCEPCYDGKIYKTGGSCKTARVGHLTKGKCDIAQFEGQWCYSNEQCDNTYIPSGSGFKSLSCMIDATHQEQCDSVNPYCSGVSVDTYNKYCIYTSADACYHDNAVPLDRFTTKDDELCYVMQQIGKIRTTTPMFCNDLHQCKDATGNVKNCEDFSASERTNVQHVTGYCEVDYCPASDKPYLSTDCMRAPGFWDPVQSTKNHHVAFAGTAAELRLSLVYCDGTGGASGSPQAGGICRWRKSRGEACSYPVECVYGLDCISGKCTTKICSSDADCIPDLCINGRCVPKGQYGIVVKALNGLSKPARSPFTQYTYDFVVSCDKKDYQFEYSSDIAIKMKYAIGSSDLKFFGDSEKVTSTKMQGEIQELCDYELEGNKAKPPYKYYELTFMPLINGKEDPNLVLHKSILVLSRSLSLDVFRCDGSRTDPLCTTLTRYAYILKQNNSLVSGESDFRSIMCDGSKASDDTYENPLYPRTTFDFDTTLNYARLDNWTFNKYYKCTDMYGSVYKNTVLINPAEAVFSFSFDWKAQLFLILVVLLGIPTLVLASSRAKRG